MNEDIWVSIEVSLKFVPEGSINNISALVQIMAWRRPDDKPLCEPMMNTLLTHTCGTRPQWVKNASYVVFTTHVEMEIHPALLTFKDLIIDVISSSSTGSTNMECKFLSVIFTVGDLSSRGILFANVRPILIKKESKPSEISFCRWQCYCLWYILNLIREVGAKWNS